MSTFFRRPRAGTHMPGTSRHPIHCFAARLLQPPQQQSYYPSLPRTNHARLGSIVLRLIILQMGQNSTRLPFEPRCRLQILHRRSLGPQTDKSPVEIHTVTLGCTQPGPPWPHPASKSRYSPEPLSIHGPGPLSLHPPDAGRRR
jgi:hypothetical protein